MIRHLTILLFFLLSAACRPSVPHLLLEVDGYDYVIGDVVEIKRGDPNINDVVVYDPFKNESICSGFGPAMALGRVIGIPGQVVTIDEHGLNIDGQRITLISTIFFVKF